MKFATFIVLVSICLGGCDSSQTVTYSDQDTLATPKDVLSQIPFGNLPVDTTNYPELRANVKRLVNDIQSASLLEKSTVQLIPNYILNYMDTVSNGFTIANPDEEWQVGCTVDKPLPSRQLIYFAMSDEIAVMTYRTGGWGVCGHLAVFEIENSTVKNSWIQYAPDTLDSKKDIIAFLNTPQNGNILISSRLDTH